MFESQICETTFFGIFNKLSMEEAMFYQNYLLTIYNNEECIILDNFDNICEYIYFEELK
jgi:hypothetical protein